MLTEYERPLTEQERARLVAWLPTPHSFWREWKRSLLRRAAVLIVLYLLAAWIWNAAVAGLVPVLYIFTERGYGKAILSWRRNQRIKENRFHSARNAVLAATSVRVQRVESETVVEVLHDEVVIYLFDLGDGRLFWHGVMSGDKVDSSMWPNSCFELWEVPSSKESFGPFCESKRLVPQETYDRLDLGDLPESGVIDSSLDDFLRSRPGFPDRSDPKLPDNISENKLLLENGKAVEFQFRIKDCQLVDDVFVVLLDVPPKVSMTENVFGVAQDGHLLWQIERRPETANNPVNCYTGISRRPHSTGRIWIFNWNGVDADVDTRSGKIINVVIGK